MILGYFIALGNLRMLIYDLGSGSIFPFKNSSVYRYTPTFNLYSVKSKSVEITREYTLETFVINADFDTWRSENLRILKRVTKTYNVPTESN